MAADQMIRDSAERIQELLEANNRYLERARAADAELAALRRSCAQHQIAAFNEGVAWQEFCAGVATAVRRTFEPMVRNQPPIFVYTKPKDHNHG